MSDLLSLVLEGHRVCTDTRKLQPGDLFFALKGENFDGNAYAKAALEAGAAFVVIDDFSVHQPLDERYIFVGNSLEALQELGLAYRGLFDIPVIGLGGSNGKTTTKELLLAAFSGDRKVHATAGNFNNHIGVPLTLLAMPRDTELAIIEMGTNQPGDMEMLSALCRPTHGLLTNIGKEHLELLKDLDGVQKEEGEVFRWLEQHGGTGFVNTADERVAQEGKRLSQKVEYGPRGSQAWLSVQKRTLENMEVELSGPLFDPSLTISSRLSGPHNAANILAAATVAAYFGVPYETLAAGIAAYSPANNRSEVRQHGSQTLWLDAYNANPSSMRAAIEHVCSIPEKKVAVVLGDMRELGATSREEHAGIGKYLQEFPVSVVVGIGREMKAMVEEAPEPKAWYATVEEAKARLWEQVREADIVLIKASRGMRLEGLLE